MSESLLCIDCSNRWSCLGLVVDGEPVGEINLDLGRQQASKLPNVTEDLLGSHGLKVQDLTCLAVTVGPGYFTGMRIGMAYIAGLAYALKVKVVPLSSLEVVLRSFPDWDRGLKAPLIAASREAVFSGGWLDGRPVIEEKERSRDELLASLTGVSPDFEMLAVKDPRLFAKATCEGVKFVEYPSGRAAACLAWERRSECIEPDRLRARYLREPGLGRTL